MKKRLILLAGIGVGFVLGSRAGRQSYEKLKAQVEEWWQDPRVQDSMHKAAETVKEQAPVVADRVQNAAGSAVGTVQDKVQDKVDDVKTDRERKKAEKESVSGSGSAADDEDPISLDEVENAEELILDDSISDPQTDFDDEGPVGGIDPTVGNGPAGENR